MPLSPDYSSSAPAALCRHYNRAQVDALDKVWLALCFACLLGNTLCGYTDVDTFRMT